MFTLSLAEFFAYHPVASVVNPCLLFSLENTKDLLPCLLRNVLGSLFGCFVYILHALHVISCDEGQGIFFYFCLQNCLYCNEIRGSTYSIKSLDFAVF